MSLTNSKSTYKPADLSSEELAVMKKEVEDKIIVTATSFLW